MRKKDCCDKEVRGGRFPLLEVSFHVATKVHESKTWIEIGAFFFSFLFFSFLSLSLLFFFSSLFLFLSLFSLFLSHFLLYFMHICSKCQKFSNISLVFFWFFENLTREDKMPPISRYSNNAFTKHHKKYDSHLPRTLIQIHDCWFDPRLVSFDFL